MSKNNHKSQEIQHENFNGPRVLRSASQVYLSGGMRAPDVTLRTPGDLFRALSVLGCDGPLAQIYLYRPETRPGVFGPPVLYPIAPIIEHATRGAVEPCQMEVDADLTAFLMGSREITMEDAVLACQRREAEGTETDPALMVDLGGPDREGPHVIIDGNHRMIAAYLRGAETYPVIVLEHDDLCDTGLVFGVAGPLFEAMRDS